MADTRPMTVEDLAQFDELGRYDLIKGELIRTPPAGSEHGRIALALGARIYTFVQEQDLGTT